MNSVMLLVLVATGTITGALTTSSATDPLGHATGEDWKPASPRFPACLTGTEFAVVVTETSLAKGRVYYERLEADGTVEHYFCAFCTVCANYGLATASPCTERSNAECSVDCLEPACVFDATVSSCRLASSGDTQGDDVTEDINSCGIQMPVETSGHNTESPLESEVKNPSSLLQGPPSQTHQRQEKPTNKPGGGYTWVASEALFVGMGIVVAVIIANVAAVLYIRSKKQAKHSKRPVTNSTEVLYAALARARTDSNVTKSGHSGSVTAV